MSKIITLLLAAVINKDAIAAKAERYNQMNESNNMIFQSDLKKKET